MAARNCNRTPLSARVRTMESGRIPEPTVSAKKDCSASSVSAFPSSAAPLSTGNLPVSATAGSLLVEDGVCPSVCSGGPHELRIKPDTSTADTGADPVATTGAAASTGAVTAAVERGAVSCQLCGFGGWVVVESGSTVESGKATVESRSPEESSRSLSVSGVSGGVGSGGPGGGGTSSKDGADTGADTGDADTGGTSANGGAASDTGMDSDCTSSDTDAVSAGCGAGAAVGEEASAADTGAAVALACSVAVAAATS
mmetsp:Transcript_24656/g.62422  ORF Transcript_24656/g.62422 Transcript_24656/m.62422 type:complete len:256 (+) Transcript_24656:449-1216(+)